MKRKFVSPMLNKPFKSPLATKKDEGDASVPIAAEPIPKPLKPSLSAFKPPSSTSQSESMEEPSTQLTPSPSAPKPQQRSFKPPMSTFKPPLSQPPKTSQDSVAAPTSTSTSSSEPASNERYFSVMYAKGGSKKHKSWSDGLLTVRGRTLLLKDEEGKVIQQRTGSKYVLASGEKFDLGDKEIEMGDEVAAEEYNSGRIFLKLSGASSASASTGQAQTSIAKDEKKAKQQSTSLFKHKGKKGKTEEEEEEEEEPETEESKVSLPTRIPGMRRRPLQPESSLSMAAVEVETPTDAYVLQGLPEIDADGKPTRKVFIDPFLAKELRPHQKEGVEFMYQCAMGVRSFGGTGCLLADHMGLGKTLQALTLFYVLNKRGPRGPPVVKKCIIVSPASLVQNWYKEVKKWIGEHRVKPLVATGNKKDIVSKINDFKSGYFPLLLISYDACRSNAKLMSEVRCDLLICDEGHRLKNESAQITRALAQIGTSRRILLSGTPLQNDMNEFFNMIDFINPGVLGSSSMFTKVYAHSIMRGREPSASPKEVKEAQDRSAQLTVLTSPFILRRTAEVLLKLLPPKVELLVFCRLTPLQRALYRHFIQSGYIKQKLLSSGGMADQKNNVVLSCLMNLKKLTNHPDLVFKTIRGQCEEAEDEDASMAWNGALQLFPDGYDETVHKPECSGKMIFLESLLEAVHPTGDKVVIVSYYTQTLDLLERMCDENGYEHCRLDGQTTAEKRQTIVDQFNASYSKTFVFLLSSKAGGVGLNITSANRLILFDPDWNPSNDLQAMSRVWRDGQKKKVYIYRLFSTGTIEEKQLQRQIAKTGLSNAIVDEKRNTKAGFSKEDLKDLFTFREDVGSDTFSEEAKEAKGFKEIESEDPLLASLLPTIGARFACGKPPLTATAHSSDHAIDSKDTVSFIKIRKIEDKEESEKEVEAVLLCEKGDELSEGDGDGDAKVSEKSPMVEEEVESEGEGGESESEQEWEPEEKPSSKSQDHEEDGVEPKQKKAKTEKWKALEEEDVDVGDLGDE